MSDLISRAEAIEAVHDACNYCDTCDLKEVGCSQIRSLKELPSADRPRGYWIGDKCSVCGEERAWYGSNPPICPDCGADMRPTERSKNE